MVAVYREIKVFVKLQELEGRESEAWERRREAKTGSKDGERRRSEKAETDDKPKSDN